MYIYHDKYGMNHLFKYLPEIDSVSYTDYFNNEFLTNHDFYEKSSKSLTGYVRFDFSEIKDTMVDKMNHLLMDKFKFPSLDYALVFRHRGKEQPIHADGHTFLRHASLNLPLSGYNGTKMVFYKPKEENEVARKADAFYFRRDSVVYDGELEGSNDWVIVNSSVPHHIVNINQDSPRMTICFRFKENLRFEEFINLIDAGRK